MTMGIPDATSSLGMAVWVDMKQTKFTFFIFSILALLFVSIEVFAQGSNAGSINQSVEGEKPFNVLFSSQHHVGFGPTVDQYTQFLLGGAYKLSDSHELSLIIPAKKLYVVPKYGVSEFQFDETYLYHLMTISPDLYGFVLQWRSGVTLPTSYKSLENGIYTVPSGTMIIGRDFFNKKLNLSYRPYTRYYFKAYQATGDGEPLPKYDLGHEMIVTCYIIPDLSLSLGASGETQWVERVAHAKVDDPTAYAKYGYNASAAYQITRVLGAEIGYGQSDSFIKDPRYEVNTYDPDESRMYF